MEIHEKLSLFHELIGCGHAFYYAVFDPELKPVDSNCPFRQHLPLLLGLSGGFTGKAAELAAAGMPVILSTGPGLLWVLDYEKAPDGLLLAYHLIGPVYVEDIAAHEMDVYLSSLGLVGGEKRVLSQQLSSLPLLPINHFTDYGLMLHCCLTGRKADLRSFTFLSPAGEEAWDRQQGSNESAHGTWAMEQELFRLIEEGNLDYRQRAARLVGKGQMSPLGAGSTLRHFKNTSIINTALSARAAIRGGLPPETGYRISDEYILAIESAKSFEEIAAINAQMQDLYVTQVHRCREMRLSPLVSRTCRYLETHTEEKLNVPTLAGQMGCSVSCLTRSFKRETGRTLKEYLLEQRLALARDALRGSDDSIQSICHRLGFASHSYFTEQFRKAVGMSPLEYRRCGGRTENSVTPLADGEQESYNNSTVNTK